MTNYVDVWAKYETKDHNGQTRRERNERVKSTRGKSPALVVPDGFGHMVEWFWELRSFCDDRDKPITPALVRDWRDMQGILISSWEADTLFRMDRVFRVSLAREVANNEERRRATEARKAKR